MSTTPNLGLALLDSSLWQSTYFKDYITELSGTASTSNMMKLDAAIQALQTAKADLVDGKVPESQLPTISSLELGETSSTAYRGDRGKIAYDHSLSTENPHGVTKAQVGLGSVDNTADADKPISTAVQAALDALSTSVNNVSTRVSTLETQIGEIGYALDAINGEVV